MWLDYYPFQWQVWPGAKFNKNSQILFYKIFKTNSTIQKYGQRGLI